MQVSHSFLDVVGQYFAECILLPLFVLAIIWIVKKWNKDRKSALAAIGIASIFVFNEIAYRIFVAVGEGSTYYRLFWIVPIALVVAAFLVACVMSMEKGKRLLVLAVILVASFMFTTRSGAEWFDIPENVYQMDEDVVQVADALMELTGGEPTYLMDDGSINNTVRQYNANVLYTDMELYDIELILKGYETNVLARDAQDAIINNHSRYIAIKKEDRLICKVMENAGIKLANETDNYFLYYVDYDQLGADWTESVLNEADFAEPLNIEYIPVSGLNEGLEYVYITDFGPADNEEVYREVLEKMAVIQPDGILINNQLSEYAEWLVQYEELLEEFGIPYYCNDAEFQVISCGEIDICMMDNREQVTEPAMKSLEELMNQGKPIVLILSEELEASTGSELLGMITKENSPIVQVLSAKKGAYSKTLLGNEILQYAAPLDSGQMLNVIRIEALEAEEIVAY